MARRKHGSTPSIDAEDYRHKGQTRKNIPPAKMAAEGEVPRLPKARYTYNPHLSPVLRFDSTGGTDELDRLIEKAQRESLTAVEARRLADALRQHQPWLEWTAKQEEHDRGYFDVDPVAIHIHERVSTKAMIRAAMREDVQRDLFADPKQPYREAVRFYKHDVDWANRLILGDSLQVMSSLTKREGLAGKVQMVYIDPPYGIKFQSNFQPTVGDRSVRDRDADLTREPEMVKAYRDTWRLGIHSYLSYLRDRLHVARTLLNQSGSVFFQIGEENVHLARGLLDDVFGRENAVVTIVLKKKGSTQPTEPVNDYILWYARDRVCLKVNRLFERRTTPDDDPKFNTLIGPNGDHLRTSALSPADIAEKLHTGYQYARVNYPIVSQDPSSTRSRFFEWNGRTFDCGANKHWRYDPEVAMRRLSALGRLFDGGGKSLGGVRFWKDWEWSSMSNIWDDLHGDQEPLYVVQTNRKAVLRCMLMTTEPGDLVLDPTCGSGTTPFVAEWFGRRWIAIDSSRVAIAITRQRLATAQLPMYELTSPDVGPRGGLECEGAPQITLRHIANNDDLDPIIERYGIKMDAAIDACSNALSTVSSDLRKALKATWKAHVASVGKRAATEAERRSLLLPRHKFEHSSVPYDAHPDWPLPLQQAIRDYRSLYRELMKETSSLILANAEMERLVDQPRELRGVLRVSGPFTVEGVRPEELSLGEDGLFDPTPNDFDDDEPDGPDDSQGNLSAYLGQMVGLLAKDGVTFTGNQHRRFERVTPLYDAGSASPLHAEGLWTEDDEDQPDNVAIAFGPQYGPVTALQVEELIRASRRYDELVVAGFSFTAEATATIQESTNPRLRIHQAYIRPDVNPGMDGLLKETPGSQLFTIFGLPEIEVRKGRDGWIVKLKGVDIYDPVKNTVRSTGAKKVAAWFIDQDFDGRCFCISQAFFPDQKAWEKIAKALKGRADPDAFARFKGTISNPFDAGDHRRIAVKVIDPRGNEVMAIHRLES